MAEKSEEKPSGKDQGNKAAAAPALTVLLKKTFSGKVLDHHAQHGDETVVIKREGMLEVFNFLKDDGRCAFDMMIDLTAVDLLPKKPRFEMVYHFKSIKLGHRLRIKIPLDEQDAAVDSIQPLWVAADWYERECWEMYGINFEGHPNLDYLLLYEGFEGNPLRKDYRKEIMQPLVPIRPIRERHDYGEIFQPVKSSPSSTAGEDSA